ncbi:MAG: hypothetical protein K9M99_05385 [Candidatus Cloacimonetes bacterium]|nr:hypothetical protein [Candidatus Cloacimonadota bacterium]
MNDEKLITLLMEVDFNQVEAEVYLALLRNSAQTGYKIAGITGKSRSNVYQALKKLEQKGAIVQLQGDSSNKYYRAVPIEQVLEQQERAFLVKKENISQAFKHLKPEEDDSQIYSLQTVSQVYEEALKLIRNTKEIIFVDATKLQLAKIGVELESATARGVKVVILSDGSYHVKGSHVINFQYYTPPGRSYEPWKIDWFCLAADGDVFLIANFEPDSEELVNALCSSNVYISGWIYSDMLYEMAFNNIIGLFRKGLSREEIWAGINDYASLFFDCAPGIKLLQKKYSEKKQ